MQPETALGRDRGQQGRETGACTWLCPYIQALLLSVDNSHVLDGKAKAMWPNTAQLEDSCSSSEFMLLIPC